MMYGYRARIGYTSPLAQTEVFPYEFYGLVPKGVTLVLTTLAVADRTRDELERSYEKSLQAAGEMARSNIDIMVLGGVPINLLRGFDRVDELIAETQARIGVPVTTSLTAQLDAMRTTGARKVAIAHPFPQEQSKPFVDIVAHYGFALTGALGGGKTGRELGRIPLETAIELCRALKRDFPETDTIWLPCPHWATVEAVDAIERELGVTAITANGAIVWQSLRRCGIDDRLPAAGRLFTAF
jgi:maleate cis-trans isomerase